MRSAALHGRHGGGTRKMVSKARMSCMASDSWRQSSPVFTMTGRSAQPGRRPQGLRRRTRSALSWNLRVGGLHEMYVSETTGLRTGPCGPRGDVPLMCRCLENSQCVVVI